MTSTCITYTPYEVFNPVRVLCSTSVVKKDSMNCVLSMKMNLRIWSTLRVSFCRGFQIWKVRVIQVWIDFFLKWSAFSTNRTLNENHLSFHWLLGIFSIALIGFSLYSGFIAQFKCTFLLPRVKYQIVKLKGLQIKFWVPMRQLPSFLFCLQENKDVTICWKSCGDKEHTFL